MKRKEVLEEYNPFDKYKNEVEYNFILKGIAKYKLNAISSETDKVMELDFDQTIDAGEEIEKQIESILNDEDFLKMYFPEVGLGRVYCKLDSIDDTINIIFGISNKELEKEFSIQDLKEDVEEFFKNLDSNIEGVHVTGMSGNEDPHDDTDPAYVTLEILDDIKIEVIKEEVENTKIEKVENLIEFLNKNKITESFDINLPLLQDYCLNNNLVMQQSDPTNNCSWELYIYNDDNISDINLLSTLIYDLDKNEWEIDSDSSIEDIDNIETDNKVEIDKLLVNEGKIILKKENNIKSIYLNDDGIIEFYENKNIYNTQPFSKSKLQKEYKQLIKEGYKIIKESEDINNIPDKNDLEQTKQNLEQGIERVDQLQDLKDELINKVDNLVNESIDSKIQPFPKSEFAKKALSLNDLDQEKFINNLTKEQINWINTNVR